MVSPGYFVHNCSFFIAGLIVSFWLIIAFIICTSLIFLTVLVLKKSPLAEQGQRQRISRNVGLYRQRLAHYEKEKAQGLLDEAEHQTLFIELSHRLLDDVEQLEKSHINSDGRKKWLWLILFAPLCSLALYSVIGAYPDWQISQTLASVNASQSEQEYQSYFSQLHDQLDKRIVQKPDNTEYRFMLAQYAMLHKNYSQAASHYGVLVELLPNDADVWAYFAQAEYLREDRKVTPTVRNAINNALAINPLQKTVLGLEGIDAFENSRWQEAITAWEQLLTQLEDSPSTELIRQGIQKAQLQLGDKVKAPIAAPGFDVTVELGNQLPTLDTSLVVFIYAKAANGPPMPLAVKRMQLRDLPATVHLDDSMAMMPQMRLSQFEQVIVGARISFSGQPVAEKGDWQGEIGPIEWKQVNKPIITINQQIQQ